MKKYVISQSVFIDESTGTRSEYSTLEGNVNSIEFLGKNTDLTPHEHIAFHFTDTFGPFVVFFKVDSGYFRSFCNLLKNCQKDVAISLSLQYKKSESGRVQTGCIISQDYQIISPFFSKSDIEDPSCEIPKAEKKEIKGIFRTDYTEQNKFWISWLKKNFKANVGENFVSAPFISSSPLTEVTLTSSEVKSSTLNVFTSLIFFGIVALILFLIWFFLIKDKSSSAAPASETSAYLSAEVDTASGYHAIKDRSSSATPASETSADFSPSVDIDGMNVLYVGIPNSITLSNFSADDDRLTIAILGGGGSLVKTGPGKYDAFVTTVTDDCKIKIEVDGKPSFFNFRVRTIPEAQAFIGGQPSGANINAGSFRAQGGVGAGIKNFPLELEYDVISFTFTCDTDVDIVSIPNQGAAFSSQVRAAINQYVQPGRMVTIDDIRVKGPDGITNKAPSLVYYIK
jgi:hypothetical protein